MDCYEIYKNIHGAQTMTLADFDFLMVFNIATAGQSLYSEMPQLLRDGLVQNFKKTFMVWSHSVNSSDIP